jgi:hypothetical protein
MPLLTPIWLIKGHQCEEAADGQLAVDLFGERPDGYFECGFDPLLHGVLLMRLRSQRCSCRHVDACS